MSDLEPMVEATEEWPVIPVDNVTVTFEVRVEGVSTLAEAIDLATVQIGRFGVDPLDILIEDADDQDRRWLVRRGDLYDVSQIVVDAAARDHDPES